MMVAQHQEDLDNIQLSVRSAVDVSARAFQELEVAEIKKNQERKVRCLGQVLLVATNLSTTD